MEEEQAMSNFEITTRLPLNRLPKKSIPKVVLEGLAVFCEQCGSYGCDACGDKGFRMKAINEE